MSVPILHDPRALRTIVLVVLLLVTASAGAAAQEVKLPMARSADEAPAGNAQVERETASARAPDLDPFVRELQERTFRFFWETANSENGLIPDRYPTSSYSSIAAVGFRSEEHTSELQSRRDLVCRLLLEKKKKKENQLLILKKKKKKKIKKKN